jgi:hypothetical protein
MTKNNIAVFRILRHDNEVVVDDGIVVVIIVMEVIRVGIVVFLL